MISFRLSKLNVFISILCFTLLFACNTEKKKQQIIDPSLYVTENLLRCEENLTKTIVPDILSPPFASRVYVYPAIAAYEVLVHAFPEYRSLVGQLNGLLALPVPDTTLVYHYELAAITAYNRVAKKLVWTEKSITDWDSIYRLSLKKEDMPEEVMIRSIDFGNILGDSILAWASRDHFKQTRSLTRYSLSDTVGAWKTTPPDYAAAVEPYWGTHRTFALQSSDQFAPSMDIPRFSTNPKSEFMKAAREVYDISKSLDSSQRHIASFWDCNPSVSTHEGHLTVFNQKMTPGGHWFAIINTLSRNKKLNIMQSAEAMALTGIGLADGFICCWKWKYSCNTIRPVSVINQYIDNSWNPFLQTPPFPEYPSGHSAISGSASVILTHLLGDQIAFTDSSELEYGLPVRSFNSVREAADEVSISRVYGGIHYRFAVDNGLELGREIGRYISEHIKTRK